MDNNEWFRAEVLTHHGATEEEIRELLEHNRVVFDHSMVAGELKPPLVDEPFVSPWRQYVEDAEHEGAFASLKRRIVSFHFPIAAGISQTYAYRAATLKGVSALDMPEATGLVLKDPDRLQLRLHQTPAGHIPLIITSCREDFVDLIRVFTKKNEPVVIPDSMGACMVAGYNNWDRIHSYQRLWEEHSKDGIGGWSEEFRRLIGQKELYQDRFIIISDGPYSAVEAAEIGLDAEEWRTMSLILRREHECAHYMTKRFLFSMRNHLMDEIIADYFGILEAAGVYHAEWFLRFVGLENYPAYREGGRLQNYRGTPSLSDRAFQIQQSLVYAAAINLERFDRNHGSKYRSFNGKASLLLGLTRLSLEELASSEAELRLVMAIGG